MNHHRSQVTVHKKNQNKYDSVTIFGKYGDIRQQAPSYGIRSLVLWPGDVTADLSTSLGSQWVLETGKQTIHFQPFPLCPASLAGVHSETLHPASLLFQMARRNLAWLRSFPR